MSDLVDAEKLALLENVVESIDQGFVVWNDDNKMVLCNQLFRELWGYPDEVAAPGISSQALLRYHLDHSPSASGYDDAAREKEVDRRLSLISNSVDAASSEQYSHYNGREILIRRFSVTGLGKVATYSDITTVRNVEEALIRKSGQLQSTLDAVDQGVAIWGEDEDLKLELCNNRFLELWGYPEKMGKPGIPVMEFLIYSAEHGEFGPGDPVELAMKYMIAKRSFFKENIDDLHTTRAGITLYVRRRFVPGYGSISTFTDVSSLKDTEDDLRRAQDQLNQQIEKLKRRENELELQKNYLEKLSVDLDRARSESVKMNQEKDRLFSILAHDLLSPFNAIIGFSSLLKMQAGKMAPEKIIESADAINESATGLHLLLANLLEWSRTQMDGAVVDLTLVQLHEVAGEVRDLFTASAAQKNILIIDQIQPVAMTTDRDMIAAVFRNLMSNAVKFTPEGGSITIMTAIDGPQAVMGVSDTGIGMPPEEVEKAFTLERVKSLSGTDGETGTGLGLQVCRDFVEQLGGNISISSKQGEGAEFRVLLPVSGPETTGVDNSG
ncbi:MAG: PAS domain-containing protein [Alphaproteobacteria bacterium]|nr:PAS domain-containing protein [Alphaproteobacteria bacterium]